MNVQDFPDVEQYRQATIDAIVRCAERNRKNGKKNQYFVLFQFATSPDTEVAQAMPHSLLEYHLDHLTSSQREDGGWDDENGLKHWQPYFSTVVLLALKNFNRLD